MRVLLDENLPVDLAALLSGHQVETVAGRRWQGVKNGELLARASDQYDALITMDRKLKDQQPLAGRPFGVILVRAASNRMAHLTPLVADILAALDGLAPGEIRRVGA